MLQPRLIPCLLISNKGLVKTTKFKNPKYVGDPINAVKIFNEKEVDELMVFDIDATANNKEPDYNLIENLAWECRMPLCYGGGIKTAKQAQHIFSLGVEKICLSSSTVQNPSLVGQIASRVGNQSVVVVMDVRKKLLGSNYEIYIHNGTKSTGLDAVEFAIKMEAAGAGELVLNSIDNDGVMQGFDLSIIDKVRDAVSIPMTVLGGAGSLVDIGKVVEKYGIIGVAAGSFFVFKGKFRAVLINYPTPKEKLMFLNSYFWPYWESTNSD
jgi:cyclase